MKVPAEVCLVYRPETTTHMVTGETVRHHETFPAYRSSEARLKSARKWAGDHAQELDRPNRFDALRILSLEERGEGGRAYKVLLDTKYLVDLREDVLVEVMLHKGIRPGGYVDATFAFLLNGSQFKLHWVESAAYKEAVSADAQEQQVAAQKKLGSRELEFGRVYKDAQGYDYLFLGLVRTARYETYVSNQAEIAAYHKQQQQKKFEALQASGKIPANVTTIDQLNDFIMGGSFLRGGFSAPDMELMSLIYPVSDRFRSPIGSDAPIPTYAERETHPPTTYQLWFYLWGNDNPTREMIIRADYNIQFTRSSTRYPSPTVLTNLPFASTEKFVEWMRSNKKAARHGHAFKQFDYLAHAKVLT